MAYFDFTIVMILTIHFGGFCCFEFLEKTIVMI